MNVKFFPLKNFPRDSVLWLVGMVYYVRGNLRRYLPYHSNCLELNVGCNKLLKLIHTGCFWYWGGIPFTNLVLRRAQLYVVFSEN